MTFADLTGSMPDAFKSETDARQHVSQAVRAAIAGGGGGGGSTIAKCGELACQMDSFAKSLDTARLVSLAFVEEAPKKKGKKGKKKAKDADDGSSPTVDALHGRTRYVLALTDSIFYPEGGGQPSDTGTIRIDSSSSPSSSPSSSSPIELTVSASSSADEICVLTCLAPEHLDPEQLYNALRADGVCIHQTLDWDRRFDLMTQHSAQHLISAVSLSDPFGMQTHSFSLSTKGLVSYVDLIVDPDVSTDAHCDTMRTVEELVNERIVDNLPMVPRYLDPSELDTQSGEVRSRLLPEGITGKIRLVEIGPDGDVDCNTCCGTHVPTLGQLQMIKFFRLERLKTTVMRVHFAAARRLMKIMDGSYERQAKLTAMMSCTEEDQVERVAQLLEDRREKDREVKKLNDRLCAFQAREVMEKLDKENNLAMVDVGDSDMGYMMSLSASVVEELGSTDGVMVLLVGGTESGDEGSFLLTGDVALVDRMGKQAAALFEGRGGGKNGKFQGKGTKIRSALPKIKEVLTEEMMG